MVPLIQCFFCPRNGKSAREAVFWSYFDFFLGQKSAFSPTFSRFFGSFLAQIRNFSPTLFDFFLGLTINFLGHNSEIFLRQKYFFFSVTLIFHSRLYVLNPHSTGRKPPAAFFKNRLEERPFLKKKNQGTPQVQIKMKNTLKERPIFIKVCNENSHLEREPKYRKTKKPSRNCILHSFPRVFFFLYLGSPFGKNLHYSFFIKLAPL